MCSRTNIIYKVQSVIAGVLLAAGVSGTLNAVASAGLRVPKMPARYRDNGSNTRAKRPLGDITNSPARVRQQKKIVTQPKGRKRVRKLPAQKKSGWSEFRCKDHAARLIASLYKMREIIVKGGEKDSCDKYILSLSGRMLQDLLSISDLDSLGYGMLGASVSLSSLTNKAREELSAFAQALFSVGPNNSVIILLLYHASTSFKYSETRKLFFGAIGRVVQESKLVAGQILVLLNQAKDLTAALNEQSSGDDFYTLIKKVTDNALAHNKFLKPGIVHFGAHHSYYPKKYLAQLYNCLNSEIMVE